MLIEIDEAFRELSYRLQATTNRYKLLICTDNRPYALAVAGFFALQHQEESSQLLGITTTEQEAWNLLNCTHGPVLAFVSEMLEEGHGVNLVASLKACERGCDKTATILTLQDLNPISMRQAIQGPSDVVLTRRGIDLFGIVNALEAIEIGQRYIDPMISFALEHQRAERRAELSDRELSVLRLVCDGLSNREIGVQLHIAETTARGHVQAIIRKLHVRDRTAAAAEAIRQHWID
jgi:two-component system response regulator DevR